MEKEETGLLKELMTGIRGLLTERLISPLMPAFVMSWSVINYRLIVAILSDETLEKRLSFIDSVLYPTSQSVFVSGFLFPLVTAMAYIFIYPYPAKWVYQYALKRQRELREARQQAENERVLTFEESQRLRSFYFDRESELQKKMQLRQEENDLLRAKISELEKTQEKPKVLISETSDSSSKISRSRPLTDLEAKALAALSYAENNNIQRTYESNLQKSVGSNKTELKIVIEDLKRSGLMDYEYDEDGDPCYSLTHEGRKAVKEYMSKQDRS